MRRRCVPAGIRFLVIMDTLTEALPFRLEPGECFAGKYLIERVLGSGGMSVVVAALHRGLQQKVAIKLLFPVNPMPPDGVRRFVREARAAAALRSHHTARVVDVDVDETGRHFIVMEHLDGEDLGRVLQREGALSIQNAVGYVLHACEAMAEAHPLGIIHRDLKPQNLFLTQRIDGTPLVKVLDFGVSKFTAPTTSGSPTAPGRKASSLSTYNALLGTPHYMSPEQIRTPAEIDGRSDVWSLGVILFELLTKHEPFSGDTIPDVMAAVLQDTPPSPAALRAEVPAELAKVVLACLEKDVSDRVQSMGELARLLLPWAPAWARDAAAAAERLAEGSLAFSLDALATEAPVEGGPLVVATARIHMAAPSQRRGHRWRPTHSIAATCAVVGCFLVGSSLFQARRGASWAEAESRDMGVSRSEAEPVSAAAGEPVSTPVEAATRHVATEVVRAEPILLPSSPAPAPLIAASVVANEPRPQASAPTRPPATKPKPTPRARAPFPTDPLVGRR